MNLFQAEKKLSGTVSADKNELLFTEFGINYNNEPVLFRKGTTLLKKIIKDPLKDPKKCLVIFPFYKDLIKNKFWEENAEILNGKGPQLFDWTVECKLLPNLVLKQIASEEKKVVSEI